MGDAAVKTGTKCPNEIHCYGCGLVAVLLAENRQAVRWLLRAYDSGHRKGWEPGPTVKETMDELHAFLCDLGYDPNERETIAWLREVEAS